MEKLVLELMKQNIQLGGRIESLEKIVSELENKVIKLADEKNINEKSELTEKNNDEENSDKEDKEDKEDKLTRSVVRKYIIKKIQGLDSSILVESGRRSDNTDLKIFKDNIDTNLKIRLYTSRSYNKDYSAGWFTPNIEEFQNKYYDLYIMCVEFKTYIFSYDEIINIIKQKSYDKNGKYHFYLHHRNNGEIIECREQDIDVSKNLEAWDVLKDIIL